MGRFIYESVGNDSHVIDDRVLAHLELAIGVKFRRGESFAFTLTASDLKSGQGQRVFWMHPSIPVQFHYDGDRRNVRVNPAWVERLVESAFTEVGLRILPEPPPNTAPKPLVG